jgi:RNA polymerase sigma-70 factor (ECF subfamily)
MTAPRASGEESPVPDDANQADRRASASASDAELLQQIRRSSSSSTSGVGGAGGGNDEAAFRTLLDRHANYLYGIARALTGNNAADADDLVQDVFVAMLTSHFRGESSVRTWLVKILVRRSAMMRRSRSRKILPLRMATGGGDVSSSEDRSGPVAKPSSTGPAAVDARLDLAAMLEKLSPDHRRVIVLRELEGLSYEEMADVLGVPRGTVESRLHRAREELRNRLKRGYES